MLAHAGRDDGFALGLFVENFNGFLRSDVRSGLV